MINKEELFKQYFQLNKLESEVLNLFFEIENEKNNSLDILTISQLLEKDRTTIQKLIKILLNKELIYRKQVNNDRGFKFIYCSGNTKTKLLKHIREHLIKINNVIEDIEKWK